MSHKIYTTEAFVCGSFDSKTSDKTYMLFTKDSGMLFASAKSVREEKSKQRYALQDFSLVRVSLLKGKSGWKVGSVEALGNGFMRAYTRHERALIHFLFEQVRKYVHGEEAVTGAYADIEEVFTDTQRFADNWRRSGEIFLLRMLTALGYTAPNALWEILVSEKTLAAALERYVLPMEKEVSLAIAEAGLQSHL